MDSETEVSLLLNCDQVSRLVGFKRSKIYEMMREKQHPFPAQVYRGPVAARRRRALGGRAGQEGRGVSAAEPSPQ